MNRKNVRSLSYKVEQLCKVYAPRVSRAPKKLFKRRHRFSVEKPAKHRKLSMLKPESICEILCHQELAYEIISRDLHLSIKDKFGLIEISYSGHSFVIKGKKIATILKAINELSELMAELRPKSIEQIENSGTAEDLSNVTFHDGIEFLGEPECVFCGESIQSGQKVKRTICLHIFHMQCIQPWLSNKQVCPVDKMPI